MNRRRIVVIVLCVAVLALVWSRISISVKPGYMEDDKKATAAAIDKFHARLNAAQFDEIFDDANALFQKSQDRQTLIRSMRETRDRFGGFEQVTFSRLNVIVGPMIQIRAVYNTRFQNTNATEQFVFVKEGDKVKLAQYAVSTGTVRPSEP